MVDKKYNAAYAKSTHKQWFSENLVEDFNNKASNLKLDINDTIDVNTYYLMSNENLIYFSMIIDKLGTDEQLLDAKEYPADLIEYSQTDGFNDLPKRQMVPKIVEICTQYNLETNNSFLRSSLDTLKIKYHTNPTEIRTMINTANITQLRKLYDRLLDHYHPINPHEKADVVEETKAGHGLKPSEKQIHRKYFIDTHKLNNNVLEVRYNKNRHLTNVKTQVIGNGVKNIIHNIINDNNMNQNDYHVLTQQEKHLIRTILNMLDKNHLVSNADEEFNERFQILLSEYNAGNNSEILRNQIKQYILHAMKLNMIGRQAGQQMIIEMCF